MLLALPVAVPASAPAVVSSGFVTQPVDLRNRA